MLRLADEADEMEERFERLAVAREVLAERRTRRRRAEGEDSAKPNAPQVLEITANGEIVDFSPQKYQELRRAKAKRFSFASEIFQFESEIFPFASEISVSFRRRFRRETFRCERVWPRESMLS